MPDKLLSAGLLAILCMLQYRLWVGEGSVAHVQSLRVEIAQQQQLKQQLQARNQRIERQVVSLKNDPGAIEARARSELGMIKQGETFYVFVDDADTSEQP